MNAGYLVVTLFAGEPNGAYGPFASALEARECARKHCMSDCQFAAVAHIEYTMSRTVETDEPRPRPTS